MAIEALNQIKDAEKKADEIRRTASIAAKDALKTAAKECEQIEDELITQARREGLEKVDAARQQARAKLDAKQKERTAACDALKTDAEKRIEQAVDTCLKGLFE